MNPEQAKYEGVWENAQYRQVAPGENILDYFLEFEPSGTILDIGCGTGRASLRLAEKGYDVFLVDLARNCLDEEVRYKLSNRFLKADITDHVPIKADWGYCTDVMEHLPPEQVSAALDNIASACDKVFFSICLQEAGFDKVLGEHLHLTVRPYKWWRDELRKRWSLLDARDWITDGIYVCSKIQT